MTDSPNIAAEFPTVPLIHPRPDLGVPDPEDLLAHYLAEHGGDSGYRAGENGFVDGVVAFGGFDTACEAWPTDEELAAARERIGERR